MVTKAIERAQRTVEDRNFEIRKDVLQYDQVMNEQRKVIYKRRQQILEGGDLRDEAFSAIQAAIRNAVELHCPGEFPEEWDVEELHRQIGLYFPIRVTIEQINGLTHRDELVDLLHDDAAELYEAKEDAIGTETLREIERRVMLSVIDQHWREHLYEMDYLREGINLRAMGQRDPLAEWQREGFDMFSAMMGLIEEDFVRYVFHLEVVTDDETERPARGLSYSSSDDAVQGSSGFAAAAAAAAADDMLPAGGGAATVVEDEAAQQPVRVEKTPGRNEPCYCGSGKKFKLCHGANR
jgi:preprotein translocase subunit SecA